MSLLCSIAKRFVTAEMWIGSGGGTGEKIKGGPDKHME